MADFGTPVAGQNPPTSGLTTLQDLMSLRSSVNQQAIQRQSLQSGALGIQQQQIQNTGAQMSLQERQNVQQVIQSGKDPDGNPIKDAAGDMDMNAAPNWLTKVAPTTWPTYMQQFQQVADNKLKIQKSASDLQQGLRDQIGGALQSGVNDPTFNSAKAAQLLAPIGQANPEAAPAIASAVSLLKLVDNTQDPAKKNDAIVHTIQAFRPSAANQPGTIDTGGTIQPTSVQPFTGALTPTGAPIPKTLAPQIISQPISGAPAVVGGAGGTTPRMIGANGSGGSPWQPYQGQAADVQNFQNEVQQTRADAQQAPLAHNINQQILRLADNAKTGPGTDVWQHAVGALGAPLGLSPSANYQELGKFLEKNAINNMQSMGGPPSDARLSAAAAANGSTTFSPEALKAVTKFNDATTTALQQYRQGMDQAVGMGQNVNYTSLPAYKAAWAKNFDVNIYRVDNAMRDGDTKELHQIAQELGPGGLKALAVKRENLQSLSRTGQLP